MGLPVSLFDPLLPVGESHVARYPIVSVEPGAPGVNDTATARSPARTLPIAGAPGASPEGPGGVNVVVVVVAVVVVVVAVVVVVVVGGVTVSISPAVPQVLDD